MEKILSKVYAALILSLCGGLLLLSSCADEYTGDLKATTNPAYLNVDKSSLAYQSSGGVQQLGIQSVGVSWQIGNQADWISLDRNNGSGSDIVNVHVASNDEYSDRGRATVLSVTGSDITRNVTVSQESPALKLEISPKQIDMPGSVYRQSISISSNVAWTYTVANGEWLQVSQSAEGLSLTASENITGASRTAVINISSGSKLENVSVTQRAADITVSTDHLEFGNAADNKPFSFTSEASWTAKTNYSWVEITPSSGSAGNNNVTVAVTANYSKNQRIGTFAIGNKEVTVTQEGVVLSPSTQSLTFIESGETQTINLKSNIQWKLKCTYLGTDKDWLQISKTEGNGDTDITISADQNNGTIRTAFLQFVSTDGDITSDQIAVSQNGNNATPINSLPKFSIEGGIIDFDVAELSNTSTWNAAVKTGAEWIHVSPTTGKGNTPLTIKIDATTVVEDRSGEILLSFNNGARYIISINQVGLSIVINPTQYHFFAKGGTSEALTLQYAEGSKPSASSSESWLATKIDGHLMTVTATENFTGAVRQAVVTICIAGRDDTAKLTITQANQHGDFVINDYDGETDLFKVDPEAVDLGLSVKWASFNIGARNPEDYGDYYAWGETEPKDVYDWSTYKWCNGSYTMTKYCANSQWGTVDNKKILDPEDDVAHVRWGGSWRMPTKAEQDELRESCDWTWTTQNGVNGYKVTSKTNGNCIFLPVAGYLDENDIHLVGSYGFYWSSSLFPNYDFEAYNLFFDSDRCNWNSRYRSSGHSVRAVCP